MSWASSSITSFKGSREANEEQACGLWLRVHLTQSALVFLNIVCWTLPGTLLWKPVLQVKGWGMDTSPLPPSLGQDVTLWPRKSKAEPCSHTWSKGLGPGRALLPSRSPLGDNLPRLSLSQLARGPAPGQMGLSLSASARMPGKAGGHSSAWGSGLSPLGRGQPQRNKKEWGLGVGCAILRLWRLECPLLSHFPLGREVPPRSWDTPTGLVSLHTYYYFRHHEPHQETKNAKPTAERGRTWANWVDGEGKGRMGEKRVWWSQGMVVLRLVLPLHLWALQRVPSSRRVRFTLIGR